MTEAQIEKMMKQRLAGLYPVSKNTTLSKEVFNKVFEIHELKTYKITLPDDEIILANLYNEWQKNQVMRVILLAKHPTYDVYRIEWI